MPPTISVVVPMYNEEAYVRRIVDAVRAALRDLGGEGHEIILVNDASTDRTATLADEISREDPSVTVLHNDRNRRLGGSLRRAYAAATKDLILYTDADLPFDLMELPRAVRLLDYQQADVLSAYRFDRTSEGVLRTLYTLAYSALIRTLFSLRLRDVNFSFKLFRRSLLDKIELRSEGSFIDVEFLLRARKAGAAIIQIGVDYFPRSRGVSTLASPSVILGILREMGALWRELR
jgi:glycosyltransferase involved in cell wall biosynthesis